VGEKEKLTDAIFKRLERKTTLSKLINEAFAYMKGKLSEKERKANLNGMNGSLIFKMIQNDKPQSLRPLNDKKLMIYDVLKSKHREYMRQEKVVSENSQIEEEQFIEFSALQVMGIIELEGGYKKLQEGIARFERQEQEK
jgi:hypothetical protein